MRCKLLISLLVFIILFGAGAYCIVNSLTYFSNEVHYPVKDIVTFYIDEVGYFYLKITSVDSFMANNPLNISIVTGAINPSLINQNIQLIFYGAEQYFPINEEMMSKKGLYALNASAICADKYKLVKNNTKLIKNCFLSYLDDYEDPVSSAWNNYVLLEKKGNSLKGKLTNISYNSGGLFDIGVIITPNNFKVFSLDPDYLKEDVINIAPPETKIAIKSNNILIGLAWLAVGISLLIPVLIEFLRLLEEINFTILKRKTLSRLKQINLYLKSIF